MKSKHQLLALALATLAGGSAQAALSVGSSSYTYGQNFDSLATTSTNITWANDSTLAGWSLFTKDNAGIATYNTGTGSSNTGAFYSFGAAASTERALGGVASGGAYFGSPAANAVAGYIAVSFSNQTGADLAGFTLNFNGEQWRDGGATTPAAQTMVLEYGYGSTFAGVTSWTAAGSAFNNTSPVFINTSSGAAVDGNAAGRVNALGGTVSTAWTAGETLWIRWVEKNDIGNDHGLAIDDVSFSVVAAAVPEPGTYAMLLAGLGCIGFIARRRKI